MARPSPILALTLALTGCASAHGASAPGATLQQLQTRAQLDLGCPASYLRHHPIDERTKLVQGCQRQLVYVESCERIRGASRCTWRVDSPWLYAPQIQVAPPSPVAATEPCPGDGLLNVASEGGFCDVMINGEPHGVTPIAGIKVPQGPNVVTCTSPKRTLSRQVRVQAGRTARVRFDLDEPVLGDGSTVKDWGF